MIRFTYIATPRKDAKIGKIRKNSDEIQQLDPTHDRVELLDLDGIGIKINGHLRYRFIGGTYHI
jgi:hypothetical protein